VRALFALASDIMLMTTVCDDDGVMTMGVITTMA